MILSRLKFQLNYKNFRNIEWRMNKDFGLIFSVLNFYAIKSAVKITNHAKRRIYQILNDCCF